MINFVHDWWGRGCIIYLLSALDLWYENSGLQIIPNLFIMVQGIPISHFLISRKCKFPINVRLTFHHCCSCMFPVINYFASHNPAHISLITVKLCWHIAIKYVIWNACRCKSLGSVWTSREDVITYVPLQPSGLKHWHPCVRIGVGRKMVASMLYWLNTGNMCTVKIYCQIYFE